MYLSCHISVLSEVWVNGKGNARLTDSLKKIMFFFLFSTESIRTPGKKNRITHFVTVPPYFWETKGNNKGRNGAYFRG